jgi:hypothetical protein
MHKERNMRRNKESTIFYKEILQGIFTKLLQGVYKFHGLSRVLVSDRDPKFVSGLRKTLRRRLGSRHNMSSNRHFVRVGNGYLHGGRAGPTRGPAVVNREVRGVTWRSAKSLAGPADRH